MCTYKLELEKQPIAVEIAFTLSQLDVTAIRIFLTEIGNATDNDVFELFVICVPHCLYANSNPVSPNIANIGYPSPINHKLTILVIVCS